MASAVEICNRALQKLGAKRITSLLDESSNARSCNTSYEALLDFELREHPWNFAIKRATLAADKDAPEWGRKNAFILPSDFLRLLPNYPEMNHFAKDWQIERGKILTNEDAPLYIRYISKVTDPNEMDSAFRELLSCKIAYELCEEITQSNTKKDFLIKEYDTILKRAKKINAIENAPADLPVDSWWIWRS